MKKKLSPKHIIDVLHSIKDVRLDKDNEVEVLFDPPSTTFPGGWEPNAGFVYNSFTQQLLALIQDGLNGELETNDFPEA